VVFLFLVQAKYKIRCGQEGLAIMPLFLKQAVKMGDTIFQHLKPQSLRYKAPYIMVLLIYKTFTPH